MADDTFLTIQNALITLGRRAADPRGNRQIQERAGVAIERAEAVMLYRLGELEPARLSELAEAAGVEISTASRPMARLVAQGYVERSPDPSDGRATVHRLTAEGRELLTRLSDARDQWLEDLLGDFDDDDRARFAELLDRFVRNITAAS